MAQINLPTTLGEVRSVINAAALTKRTFGASAAPQGTDNAAQGYEVGSEWFFGALKYRLVSFTGASANWILEYDDTELRGRVGALETSLSGLPARVTAAETSIAALSTASGAHATQIAGLTGRVTTLENAGGGGATDAGAIEGFGGVMSVFPVLTPPSRAVMEANRTALLAALAWSASTGGVVQIGYGILYIWGEAELPLGAAANGKGMDASRIQQGNLPQSAAEAWLDVLTAPAVSGSTGGNGYNNITNLTVDGGWNRQNFIGAAGNNWSYDPARMVATGIRITTPTAGTGGDAAFRAQGSDAHVRFQNVLFQNIAGPGFHVTGRGENFFNNIEIRLCHKGYYLAAPDCFATLMTIYTIGDVGAELRAGAGNLRWFNSKSWFIGMANGYEPIGAGIYVPDPGTAGMTFAGVDTQDTWGPGLVMSGDSNLTFDGQIDEAGGGRLEQQGFGWRGTRSLPRAFVRLGSTCRRATINAQIRGGARNGTGNYPYLAHLSGSGAEFNKIQFEGPLAGVNMASGTITGVGTTANGIVLANGLTNGTSPRYNEIRHGFRLLYGAMTEADLNNAAHPVNDATYGPGEVTMTSGVKARRRNAGLIGWNIHRAPYLITEAAFAALSAAEQNADDRIYIVTE